MRANNLTLLTDLYELTMMQGYFKNPTDQTVVFDMFYRDNPCGGGFAICAGLEQVIEYIENLRFTDADIEYLRSLSIFEEDFLEYLSSFHFTGDIYAIPEGTVIFPREPMVKVVLTLMIVTAFGCNILRTSLRIDFTMISKRLTLIPPPVDPAQAPTNISANNIDFESSGHWS